MLSKCVWYPWHRWEGREEGRKGQEADRPKRMLIERKLKSCYFRSGRKVCVCVCMCAWCVSV